MSAPVLLAVADGIAEIRFSRPQVLNALDLATGQAFVDAIDRVLADRSVRVVLLSGEGRSFMAGGDLAAFRDAPDRPALIASLIDPLHQALLRLAQAPAITIAAGQGPIAGAGVSIFLGADLGLLADDARLNLAYARIGASPDCGGSFALSRLVGQRKALEIALLSEDVPAAEALRLGLANRMVPAERLRAEAQALAARLAAGPALAQANIKALLRGAPGRGMAAQLEAEAESFVALAATQDFAEGLDAFFDHRPPDFVGR